ncbi:28329_t:CDS:2, partial [Dentiscutata erythropus]
MSTGSNFSNNYPEDCSEEENLQIQLVDNIYVSDLEDDNVDTEQEEIIQKVKFSTKEADVWKFVDKETHKCFQCSKIFESTTSTSSIHIHLQYLHKLLNKEKSNIGIKKHSAAVQAEKTQAILKWIILSLKLFKVVEEKTFHNMIQKLDLFYQIPT